MPLARPSVFIVAAAPALRAGLRAMLEPEGVEVAGDAAQLPDEVDADVLLLAGEAPLDEVDRPVVLLSSDSRQALALQERGLSGWAIVPPDAAGDQLLAALNAVARGLAALAPGLLSGMLAGPAVEVSDPLQEALTPRELEVLQLVSQGLSNKLIARQLGISEHTVKFHVSSTYAKLGAASRTEAVSLAARKGLIAL
jgi:DNA-binding NarL/FixJ family response regulator